MSVEGWLAFIGIYMLAIVSPGPGMVLLMARVLGHGLDRIGWLFAGFILGDLILLTLAALGTATLVRTVSGAVLALQFFAAGYLLYMAYKLWTSPVLPPDPKHVPERTAPLEVFLSSFLLTLSNPKAILFFVSIMPLAVDLAKLDFGLYLQLVVVIALGMPIVLIVLSTLMARARGFFRSVRALRILNRVLAALLTLAAIFVLTR